MGGSCSCAMCDRTLSGDGYIERKENLNRIVDRVETITYIYGDLICYKIESINGDENLKLSGYKIGSYYCFDCFWKLKYEKEMKSGHFEYAEWLNVEKGHSSTCTQPYKAPSNNEERANLADINILDVENEDETSSAEPESSSSDDKQATTCSDLEKEEPIPNADRQEKEDSTPESSEDEESDCEDEGGARSFDAVLDEVLELELSMDLVSDRNIQSRFQTCLLSCYATLRDLGEIEVDVLLQEVSSITTSLNDLDFFSFTKTMALLCKNLLSQPMDQIEVPYADSIVDRFLAGVIVAGNSNQACLKVCITNLASTTLNCNEELQQMIFATVSTALWLPRDVLVFLNLVKTMSLADDPDLLLNRILHFILSYRVPFDALKSTLENAPSDQVLEVLRERFGSIIPKSITKVCAQIAEELGDDSLLHKIKTIVENVLESLDTSTNEDLISDAKAASKKLPGENDQIQVHDLNLTASSVAAAEMAIHEIQRLGCLVASSLHIATILKALSYCVHKSNGYHPSVTQLVSLCLLLVSHQRRVNRILEVLTGEGKSCIIAMFAAALAMQENKVDVVTSSAILAQRDAKEWSNFFQMLGLSVAHNTETEDTLKMQAQDESKADNVRKKCYESAIVYGTVSSFSADILHQEFEMRDVLGERKSKMVIVDEVDMLMLDEGIQFTYLSHRAAVLRHIEQILALVWAAVRQNSPLMTSNGRVLFPGVPKYIHNVIFEGIRCKQLSDSTQLLSIAAECGVVHDPALQQILEAKSTKQLKAAMQPLRTKNMLELLGHLHGYIPCRFKPYVTDELGELVPVPLTQTAGNGDTNSPEFSLLVMDGGMASPLYTQMHLAHGVQKVVSSKCGLRMKGLSMSGDEKLHKINDKCYFEGVSHYFQDALFDVVTKNLTSTKLLSLAVKYQLIEQLKANQFNCTKHYQTKKKIMKILDEKCLQHYISTLNDDPDIDLPFKIVSFTLKKNVVTKHSDDEGCRNSQKPEVAVVLNGEGMLCPLHPNGWCFDDAAITISSNDGSVYRIGTANFFHEVILDMINSTRLLKLAVDLDLIPYENAQQFLSVKSEAAKRDALKPLTLESILTLFDHLSSCCHRSFALYELSGNQLLKLKKKWPHDCSPDTLILFKCNGMLCQLHVQETADIPGFLKEFAANQLPMYIDSAFTALLMTEKREYLIRHGKIVPVDYRNTGVIETNKRWGGGLQQMLEMKHQLQISPISVITNFLSHVQFFRRYQALYGLSGTIGLDCELNFLKESYSLLSCRIPSNCHRKFYEKKEEIVHGSKETWLNQIHEAVTQATVPNLYAPGRAVLILCEDIQTTVEIEGFLKKKEHEQLFTFYGLSGQEGLFEHPRSSGDVIIATNLAGRGTNIKLEPEVEESGGLFCLLTFLPRNRRVELQVFGRTARYGRPGSAQLILHASSLPYQYRGLDISTIRKLRAYQENHRLYRMVTSDVKEVQLRESLFSEYCAYLRHIHDMFKDRTEKLVVIDCINEVWGQWLQTKQSTIRQENWQDLQKEIFHLQEGFQSILKEKLMKLPGGNFIHHIKLGNILSNKKAKQAIDHYNQAISMELEFAPSSQFTAIAYYNRAYCTINVRDTNYIDNGTSDLKRAKDLLKIYVGEVYVIMQCSKSGRRRNEKDGKTALSNQMNARLEILQSLAKKIDQTIEKLAKFKKDGDSVEAVQSTFLELIQEPDLVTDEELQGLAQLGLEFLFEVQKKPEFSWGGLFVFILGMVEIVAGACFMVLTAGLGSSIGMGLISEGVSDCIDGTIGMVTGEFSWTEWAIGKAASICVSLATGGVGTLVEEGVEGFRIGLKAFPDAVEHGWGQVAKTSMKDIGEAVGKDVVQQGVLRSLGKIEDLAVEKIVKEIVARLIKNSPIASSLIEAFAAQNPLGLIVDQKFISKLPQNCPDKIPPLVIKEACDYFEEVTQSTIASLVSDSSHFGLIMSSLSDTFHGISKHLNGMSSLFNLLQVAEVESSIVKTVSDLSPLFECFQSNLLKMCESDQGTDGSQEISSKHTESLSSDVAIPKVESEKTGDAMDSKQGVKDLKEQLAEKSISFFTEGVESVIWQNLGWISNVSLNRIVNNHAAHYASEKTVEVIGAGAKYVRPLLPAIKEQGASVSEVISRGETILKEHESINEGDLQATADHYHHQIDIVDSKHQIERSIQPSSMEDGEESIPIITLVSEGEKYNVLIDGKVVETEPEHGNGLAKALAHGLEHTDTSKPHSAQEVRQVISEIITESPHKWKDHYRREKMRMALISHSKEILNKESWGGVPEVVVAEKNHDIRVKIVSSDGSIIRPAPKGSGKEVTLQYTKDHYDVIVDGKLIKIVSEHGNCLYAAIAHEVNRLQGHQLNAEAIRSAVSREILKNPERWHDMYQRKRTMEASWFGEKHLLKGATGVKNESTKIKKNTYKFEKLSETKFRISYEQENGLKINTIHEFDKAPEGPTKIINPSYLQLDNGIEVMEVNNGAKIKKMTIEATGCSYHDNVGRCLHTLASQDQVRFTNGTRDENGSAPVSYHVIGSEAGGNAGLHFGNSVVASEHYNKLEREVADIIKDHVGDKKFFSRVTIEFEDLAQSKESMKSMLDMRAKSGMPAVKGDLEPTSKKLLNQLLEKKRTPMRGKKVKGKPSKPTLPSKKPKAIEKEPTKLKELAEKKKRLKEMLKEGINKERLQFRRIPTDKAEHFKERFETIDKAIRDEHKNKISGESQTSSSKVAQRVKSMTHEVTCEGQTLTLRMGRDTELYLRADLLNDDLKYMKVLTGPPFAGTSGSGATTSGATGSGAAGSDPETSLLKRMFRSGRNIISKARKSILKKT